jgi:hypothetical protein
MPAACLYDPIYLQHFQPDYVENPERLEQINRALDMTRARVNDG